VDRRTQQATTDRWDTATMTEHRTEHPGNSTGSDSAVRIEASGDTVRIVLLGEVDHSVVDQLDEAMREALATEAEKFVIDFRRLSFFDSACISALVRARAQVEERGGELALANVDQYARRILDLTGLLKVFVIEDSAAGGDGSEDNETNS
jgi:stage II sporulation protein AA (anti-sigma F factor antagonist)